MSDEGPARSRPTGSKQPIDLPLKRAMPRPLLAVFAVLALFAVVAATVLLVRPTTFEPTPLAERRPPPSAGFSHGAGRIAPAPTPSIVPTLPPPCAAFARTRILASGHGVLRIRESLDRLCRLTAGGTGAELTIALEGLGRARIRFGQFEVSALESTLEGETIWLNLRFARTDTPFEEFLPPLVHEGYHLGSGSTHPGPARELSARRAELDACKELILRSDWPRWCHDAEELVSLPEAEAIELLRTAGFGDA